MDIISNKLNEIVTNFTSNIQTSLIDKFNEAELFVMVTFWQNVTDLLLCILMIYIYWCCFCIIMYRDKVYLPPFGDAKPSDQLFFLFCFYFIIKLV